MTKLKRVLAITAAAAAIAGAVPAAAGASDEVTLGPCQVRSVAEGLQEWYQEVLVTGEYAPRGAIDVRLTCGVVRYGETVAYVGEKLPGPVAALAGKVTVHAGPIGSCYILSVDYVDGGYSYGDTCP